MVFGGQVAAQSLVAASRTVDAPYVAHSLHSYFLQPGDPSVPTIYDVENLRDGRSFVTRRVIAQQHGRPIYAQTVNFHKDEPGFEHEESMPDVPGPDHESVRPVSRQAQEELHADQWNVADIRFVGSSAGGLEPDPRHPGRQQVWLRVSSPLPDDPFWHRAAFTYLSDMTLIGRRDGAARHQLRSRATRSSPRSTTRCGSTGRSAPTSGGSTTRSRRRRRAVAGWSSPGSSARTATWWPRSPRRPCSVRGRTS